MGQHKLQFRVTSKEVGRIGVRSWVEGLKNNIL